MPLHGGWLMLFTQWLQHASLAVSATATRRARAVHRTCAFTPLRWLCLPVTLLLLTLNFSANATPQEAEFLRRVAEQYLLAQFQNSEQDIRVEVKADPIDDRRDFGGRCEGYLTAALKGESIRRNSQVRITCSKPGNEYSITVPVTVKLLMPALVASHNLSKGQVIGTNDLKHVYIDENTNLSSAVADPNILVGSRLKRDVKAGEQIRTNSFCVVCKNDKVNIVARSHALSLKTSGQALEDGNINDTIRVKNLKSQKVITGVVSAPATVDVVF